MLNLTSMLLILMLLTYVIIFNTFALIADLGINGV